MHLPLGQINTNSKQIAKLARQFIFYHHKLKDKAQELLHRSDKTTEDAKLRETIRQQILKAIRTNQPEAPAPVYSKKAKPTGAPTLTGVSTDRAFDHLNLRGSFRPKADLHLEQQIESQFSLAKQQEEENRQELLDRMIPRIVGLDIGAKFIGVSVSDRFGKQAQPLGVIHREIPTGERKFATIDKKVNGKYMRSAGWTDVTRPLSPRELGDRLKRYSQSFNVIGTVVGMPRDDSQGQIAVNEFITTQEYYGTFPLDTTIYVPEDYSTIEGRAMAYKANFRSGDDVKDNVDMFAATVILQRFLDGIQNEFATQAQEYAGMVKQRKMREIQALPNELDFDWDFTEIDYQESAVDVIDHEEDERAKDFTYDSTQMAERPALEFEQKKALRKWKSAARRVFSDEIRQSRREQQELQEEEEEKFRLEIQAQIHREEMERRGRE